LFRMHVTSNSR